MVLLTENRGLRDNDGTFPTENTLSVVVISARCRRIA